MPLKDVLGNSCAFVAKHLGLRHRYVFTKNNRLRLRYVAGMTAACAAGLPTAVTFSPSSVFPVQFEIATAAQAYNHAEASPVIAGFLQQDYAGDDMAEGSELGSLSLASIPQFEAPKGPSDRIVTINKGDVLGTVMQKEGVGASEVHAIIAAMGKNFNPRSLKVGQDIHMHFVPHEESQGGYQLTDLKIELNPLKTLSVSRDGDNFVSAVEEKEVKQVVQAQKAVIKNSLYGSAAEVGIPKSVVADAIRIYSHTIDFQRDVQSGDAIEVMYEMHQTDEGYVAKTGNILYASLTLGGRDIPLYRYETEDGSVDYFGPDGQSTKKTLMKTPIDGARTSSGYGMRRHPVLGYNRMHKGIDFAAPTGTPIFAAGDGRIQQAGRFSSYGNYVRIRHRSDLDTAYAHMSRIAPHVKAGARVKQGEIIGYVGTTGRSTGPHLHYEVLVAGKHVNPRGINLPIGQALAGRDLKKFKSHVAAVNNEYASLSGASVKVAQRDGKRGGYN
ncbi:MAG: peptidoglycan DD-metalloendopeptidase family protein [Micavibrio sp.]